MERIVKESTESNASWKCKYRDGIESVVACPQLLSDRSHVSLNTRELGLYPLHVKLPNFAKEWRRHNLTSWTAVTAYLPVRLDYDSCSEDATTGSDASKKRPSNECMFSRSFMTALNLVSNILRHCALEGLDCTTPEKKRLFHIWCSHHKLLIFLRLTTCYTLNDGPNRLLHVPIALLPDRILALPGQMKDGQLLLVKSFSWIRKLD